MMSTSSRTRYPFTTSQWQELEHQALIFKYMISGMPIPPHLLCMIRRSYDSSLLLHQPPQLGGWSYYQMGSMKKVDPEPGRCRRTDGKKWRCSKEAYPDSKYCERHMHRGRNRSRKPVEFNSTSSTSSPKTMSVSSFTRNSNSSSPTISPSSSFKSLASESHQFTSYATGGHHHPFLYPQSSSRTIIGSDFSGQENVSSINNTLWESSAAFSDFGKGYRNEREEKLEVNELPFFSETSGTMRNISGTSLQEYGQLNINNLKQRSSYHEIGHSSFQIQSPDEDPRGQKHDYLGLDSDVKNEMSSFRLMERDVDDDDDDKPKKVMHHFFDEWPLKDRFDSDEEKLSRNGVSSEIQLSISMPNSSDNFFFCKK